MYYVIRYGLDKLATVKSRLPAKTKILEENKNMNWIVVQSPAEWGVMLRLFEGTQVTVSIDHTHDKKKVA